jgi:hypothetical protein
MRTEPICDQHVLRAFQIRCLTAYSPDMVNKIRRKSVYKSVDKPILNKYRDWFKQLITRVPIAERKDYKALVDQIIFLYGKDIKL